VETSNLATGFFFSECRTRRHNNSWSCLLPLDCTVRLWYSS